jgi:eukaryotic-like serine/threonine-protein kinase
MNDFVGDQRYLLAQTISHYRLLSSIGTSLIGEVYLAEDIQLGRKVALTLLAEDFTQDSERMLRLAQEARLLSALNHPNIRMIYEVGQDTTAGQTQHFIAAEFVEGAILHNHLKQTRMTLNEVLDVIAQCVTGLQAAHAAGVLHRDLKPEHIVLRPDGFVKIVDFGFAKLVEQDSLMIELDVGSAPVSAPAITEALPDMVTKELRDDESSATATNFDPYRTRPLDLQEAALLVEQPSQSMKDAPARRTSGLWWMPGTTRYLSPEQVRGEPIDERSDIFSLGVVLYEMCTGRLPFEGATTTTLLSAILQTTPPPIRRFMPEAPEELEWIVTKALAKDRDERYQTVREWLNDLRRLKQRLEFEAEHERLTSDDAQAGRVSGKQRVLDTAPLIRQDTGETSGRHAERESGRRSNPSGGARKSSGSSRVLTDVIDSVAILPLTNASNDPSAEYLSDGITESVINTLSRLPGLRVMARSTVFRYKGQTADPLTVGRELNVRAVLAGRLLQRGEQIVIKAELVDARDGALLWVEQYQRAAGDVFAIEADIAQQISEHLKVKLSYEQQHGLAQRYTHNAEAYELYLRGRYFWNQRSLDGMRKGVECFIRALRLDPDYALAHAGLANCYLMLSTYLLPPREFVPKARLAVTRALALDDGMAEAHGARGMLAFWYDWDFVRAEADYQRALELNPNYPEAHQWLAYLYAAQDRFDEALAKFRHAQRLDPLSIAITANIGEILYRAGRYEEAIAQCEKALEMDAQYAKAFYWRTLAWLAAGKLTEAQTFLEMVAQQPGEVRLLATVFLAVAHAQAGRREAAAQIMAQLESFSQQQYFPPYYLAVIAASLDNKDAAFAWLEKAYQERSGWMPWLKHEPLLLGLSTDVRFNELLRRVGLQP